MSIILYSLVNAKISTMFLEALQYETFFEDYFSL